MKKVRRRIAQFNPPMPKIMVPVKAAATAPLWLRLRALYARKAITRARRKPRRSCMSELEGLKVDKLEGCNLKLANLLTFIQEL